MANLDLTANQFGIDFLLEELIKFPKGQREFCNEHQFGDTNFSAMKTGKPVSREIFINVFLTLGEKDWRKYALPVGGIPDNSSPAKTKEFLSMPSDIADKLQDFVGRQRIFDEIDDFIAANDRGYFILLGDPGEGKSAIAAKYIQDNPRCIFHFNIKSKSQDTAAHFLENVCWQLIRGYGLNYDSIPDKALSDGMFFGILLNEISHNLSPDEKLQIVVDGLDEVDLSSQRGGNVLYLPRSLPRQIYFLVTRRRDHKLASRLLFDRPSKTYDLYDQQKESSADIEAYLWKVLEPDHRFSKRLKDWIQHQPDVANAHEFVSVLGEKSDRNFMYVTLVIAELADPGGMYKNTSLRGLPQGLFEYYEDHWERMGMGLGNPSRSRIKSDILQLYAYARRPSSISMMLEYALCGDEPVRRQDVRDVVDGWKQFLRPEEIEKILYYRIYHASYIDFLATKLEGPEGKYYAMFTKRFGKIYDIFNEDDDEIEDD